MLSRIQKLFQSQKNEVHDETGWIPRDCLVLPFRSKEEYDRFRQRDHLSQASLWQYTHLITRIAPDDQTFPGYCGLCDREVEFGFERNPDGSINFREQLQCSGCKQIARVRAVNLILLGLLPNPESVVFTTEQASLAYQWLRARYPAAIGSEYNRPGDRAQFQKYIDILFDDNQKLRFEDVTRLSFEDQSLDAIISCDVLEHVPDYQRALREFVRVLKPGQFLILSVPFDELRAENLLRARLDDEGRVEHLVEPEYHGDPVSHKGVLAYHTFGWELLEAVRNAGFSDVFWCRSIQPQQAIFSGQWAVVARR
ncbi:MAG: methyltransferase domain-containing protein [Xanthomonadaceae bacterium]|nr:methyltransferase domain-containing protein [Xanthomonadaceae bacterium]